MTRKQGSQRKKGQLRKEGVMWSFTFNPLPEDTQPDKRMGERMYNIDQAWRELEAIDKERLEQELFGDIPKDKPSVVKAKFDMDFLEKRLEEYRKR